MEAESNNRPTIAIVGGTGALGSGLARRWAKAGYNVVIGSRSAASATAAANEAREVAGGASHVRGAENVDAVRESEIVVLAVPFDQHAQVLERIREAASGKIVLDTTAPLVPPRVGTVQLPEEGSAALAAQQLLGDRARVVSAFQTVAADKLRSMEPLEGDVLVCGDSKDACETVIPLIESIGMRGLRGGPLANSVAAEALTSVMITINRQFKCQAGIKIVGIPE